MSLYATLKVGSEWVGHIDIRRITNTGPATLKASDVSDYIVTFVGQQAGEDIRESDQVIVEHVYGDGARTLMAMALAEVDAVLWERVNLTDD